MATTRSATDTLAVLRRERERLQRRAAECRSRAAREAEQAEAYEEGLHALLVIERSLGPPDVDPGESEPQSSAPKQAPRMVPRPRAVTARPTAPVPEIQAAEFSGQKPVDIGNGRRPLVDGSNFAGCVEALRLRAPHWVTPAGIVEIARQGRRDAPQHFDTVIAGEMTKQRKLRAYIVPGLQARQVEGRWQYRINAEEEAEAR